MADDEVQVTIGPVHQGLQGVAYGSRPFPFKPVEDDTDPNVPHQWFQTTADHLPGNPSCSRCQLPRENARHRGTYTATITLNSNDLEALQSEYDFFIAASEHLEGDDVWWETTPPTASE